MRVCYAERVIGERLPRIELDRATQLWNGFRVAARPLQGRTQVEYQTWVFGVRCDSALAFLHRQSPVLLLLVNFRQSNMGRIHADVALEELLIRLDGILAMSRKLVQKRDDERVVIRTARGTCERHLQRFVVFRAKTQAFQILDGDIEQREVSS